MSVPGKSGGGFAFLLGYQLTYLLEDDSSVPDRQTIICLQKFGVEGGLSLKLNSLSQS